MTEQTIVVTYWYAKQFKITTDVKEHEELSIKDDPYSGRMVKGGSITGEDETPYETVLRGDTSKNPIIMTPEKGYRIKSVIINGEQIEIKDLVKQDNSLELPYFTDVQEDKVIVVEYEKLPAVVQTQYLEEGTENQISEPTQIEGNLFDKYVTEPKDIEYYELVQEKYPQNNRGTMAEENTIVKYYYRKLPFNFKIEKEVESVTLNGDSGSKQVDLSNKKQAKVEIKYKDISSTNLEVTYKIMVTNTEKISGTARLLP